MDIPAQRLRGFGESIFATMTAEARRHDAVNLGQGFPDADGPRGMLERAAEEILSGDNQYSPAWGVPELRTAVAEERSRRLGGDFDPGTGVLITVGATEGIAATVLALVNPGDEVIVPDPAYDAYDAAIALAGARRIGTPLRRTTSPDGATTWDLDVAALRKRVGPRTALIIVNSPHNPTGSVLSEKALAGLAEIAVERDLPVLSDEVYERLVFDSARHVPVAALPGMAERTVTVSSVAKTFNATGWKTGWALGPAHLLEAVQRAKQFLTFVGVTPLQPAVAWALRHGDDWVRRSVAALGRERDLLAGDLREAGLDPAWTAGTYFTVVDLAPWGVRNASTFCRELPARAGVALIPVAPFCTDPSGWESTVRLAFCKNTEAMREGRRRLLEFAAHAR